jgi:hypothetical protein
MEYTIINSKDITKLQISVRCHINDGWKLQGGIAVTLANGTIGCHSHIYAQAMTRENFHTTIQSNMGPL